MREKLTTSDRVRIIAELVNDYRELSKQAGELCELLNGDHDSPLLRAAFRAIDLAIESTSILVGDDDGWVSWYIYENDTGKKGLTPRLNGDDWPCRTVRQLVRVIESTSRDADNDK